jgi:uncharacterized membrane protein YdbT with pleckstrin-like domain
MGFPEDALAGHEKLVLNLHPHPWILVKPALVLLIAIALGSATLVTEIAPLKFGVALLIVVAAVWFLSKFVAWYSTYFVLTSDRVMYREGIVRRNSIEIPLERINTVFSSQNLFERMLRIGDIEIESASKDGAQVLSDIRRPADVQKEIYVQMEENENRKYDRMGTHAHAGGDEASIPEQINQLAELRDKGAITEAEFQAKKAELLSRM